MWVTILCNALPWQNCRCGCAECISPSCNVETQIHVSQLCFFFLVINSTLWRYCRRQRAKVHLILKLLDTRLLSLQWPACQQTTCHYFMEMRGGSHPLSPPLPLLGWKSELMFTPPRAQRIHFQFIFTHSDRGENPNWFSRLRAPSELSFI